MKTPICEMLGIDFPLVAFSHCRDVIASVSRAGGFGVLGVTGFSPDQLELELKWLDDHIDGKPYGVDVLIPENVPIKEETGVTIGALAKRIPQTHKDFVRGLLAKYDVEAPRQLEDGPLGRPDAQSSLQRDAALKLLEVAFHHPIKLIANALGVPPQAMLDMGHAHGVPVAALVGAKEHAVRQVQAGIHITRSRGEETRQPSGPYPTRATCPRRRARSCERPVCRRACRPSVRTRRRGAAAGRPSFE